VLLSQYCSLYTLAVHMTVIYISYQMLFCKKAHTQSNTVILAENISVHGPITQSQFLGSLGINFRVEALLQNCTEEQADSLRTGYWRLVGDGEAPFWEGSDEQTPIGMGTRYLAMAIVNKKQGVPVPFE